MLRAYVHSGRWMPKAAFGPGVVHEIGHSPQWADDWHVEVSAFLLPYGHALHLFPLQHNSWQCLSIPIQ